MGATPERGLQQELGVQRVKMSRVNEYGSKLNYQGTTGFRPWFH